MPGTTDEYVTAAFCQTLPEEVECDQVSSMATYHDPDETPATCTTLAGGIPVSDTDIHIQQGNGDSSNLLYVNVSYKGGNYINEQCNDGVNEYTLTV